MWRPKAYLDDSACDVQLDKSDKSWTFSSSQHAKSAVSNSEDSLMKINNKLSRRD